ncbi:hypothetical protein NHQ30_010223 [Ciborinia camelliae]|nr:hypothetical protein NHQ30_010223 [Ciborinia camelliae]
MADTKTDTKTSVVIRYSKPGTAPPIYLAGSFPHSQWQPQEMEYTNDSGDHYIFSKAVEVEEGKEYQYKFRIGDGDWWMSDEDAPIVTDEIGNQNNLLTVPIKHRPVSNETSLEDNSTPRTIPDFDTKDETIEPPTEPTQHLSSQSDAATLATDSTLNHRATVEPEVATTKDAEGVLHTKAEMKEDEAIEQQPEHVPIALEKLDVNKEPFPREHEVKEESGASKDEALEHQGELVHTPIESKQQGPVGESATKEEFGTIKAEALEHQEESAPVAIEEPKSKQEAHLDESETKEEPKSVQEPLASEGKAKEETDLADSRITVEEKLAEELETSKSQQSEIPTSKPTITDQSIENEAEESVESTTNTAKNNDQSSVPAEVVSAPIVTVEKVDSEPHHGDDFGPGATFAQKDAHNLHAKDAVPDNITTRQQAATPELANVAAEVADSASLLDKAPTTPPISDEEAGKIGYRRLSHTPIPEVAKTAAEVADTAAQIDENFKPTVIELPTPNREFPSRLDCLDRDLDIETPFEERAPLFAHECNGPPTAEERLEYEGAHSRSAVPGPMFREFDPNDPSLEPFPSNFNQILEHVRRLENQLSEDQTDVEGNPLSPVTMHRNHHGEGADLPTPSPRSLAHEISPSLLPIAEENAEGEAESKLTALPLGMEKSQSDGNISDDPKKDSGEEMTETHDAEISEGASQDLSSQFPAIEKSRSPSPKLPAEIFTKNSSKLHPVLSSLPATPFIENKALNLVGSLQSSPTTEEDENSPTISVHPATPPTPYFERKSLNLAGKPQGNSTTEEDKNGSETSVQPATQPTSANAKVNDAVSNQNAAKTTSFAEENGDSQLRARKQPISNVPERSITPASMRSAGNDVKSRNFLRAFFQVLFVDWIGGLIRKLCGGERHT